MRKHAISGAGLATPLSPRSARWRAVAPEVLAEPTNASRCTTLFPKDYK